MSSQPKSDQQKAATDPAEPSGVCNASRRGTGARYGPTGGDVGQPSGEGQGILPAVRDTNATGMPLAVVSMVAETQNMSFLIPGNCSAVIFQACNTTLSDVCMPALRVLEAAGKTARRTV